MRDVFFDLTSRPTSGLSLKMAEENRNHVRQKKKHVMATVGFEGGPKILWGGFLPGTEFFSIPWGAGNIDPGLVTEMVLWLFVLILFIIFGLAILIKLRREEKNARLGRASEGGIDRFQDLYEKKLITWDEFQMIRKNLRNQLVYDVLHQESELEKKEKRVKDAALNDKEKRLKSLLEGMENGD